MADKASSRHGEPESYGDVPWYRRCLVVQWIPVLFFLMALTGPLYYPEFDKDGRLKRCQGRDRDFLLILNVAMVLVALILLFRE